MRAAGTNTKTTPVLKKIDFTNITVQNSSNDELRMGILTWTFIWYQKFVFPPRVQHQNL